MGNKVSATYRSSCLSLAVNSPAYLRFRYSLQDNPQLSACLDAANWNTSKNHSLVYHGNLEAMVVTPGIMFPDFVPSPEAGNSIFK